MRLNLVRSVGIGIGIIAVFLVAPTLCAASMDSMDMTSETHASMPQYISASDSPLSHHALMNALNEQVAPLRLIPDGVVYLSWSPADLTTESSLTAGSPVQGDVRDHAPPPKPIEYHCRNFLSSEEPPL